MAFIKEQMILEIVDHVSPALDKINQSFTTLLGISKRLNGLQSNKNPFSRLQSSLHLVNNQLKIFNELNSRRFNLGIRNEELSKLEKYNNVLKSINANLGNANNNKSFGNSGLKHTFQIKLPPYRAWAIGLSTFLAGRLTYELGHAITHSATDKLASIDNFRLMGYSNKDINLLRTEIYEARRRFGFNIPANEYMHLVKDALPYIYKDPRRTTHFLEQAGNMYTKFILNGSTPADARNRGMALMKATDVYGHPDWIGSVAGDKFFDKLSTVLSLFGNSLQPGVLLTAMRNSKGAGKALNLEGLVDLGAIVSNEGARAGTYLNNASKRLTGFNIPKAAMIFQRAIGLRNSNGTLTSLGDGIRENLPLWILQHDEELLARFRKMPGHEHGSNAELFNLLAGNSIQAQEGLSLSSAYRELHAIKNRILPQIHTDPTNVANQSVIISLRSLKDSIIDATANLVSGASRAFLPWISWAKGFFGSIDNGSNGVGGFLSRQHPLVLAAGGAATIYGGARALQYITGLSTFKTSSLSMIAAAKELMLAARMLMGDGIIGGLGGGLRNKSGSILEKEVEGSFALRALKRGGGFVKRLGGLKGSLTGLSLGIGGSLLEDNTDSRRDHLGKGLNALGNVLASASLGGIAGSEVPFVGNAAGFIGGGLGAAWYNRKDLWLGSKALGSYGLNGLSWAGNKIMHPFASADQAISLLSTEIKTLSNTINNLSNYLNQMSRDQGSVIVVNPNTYNNSLAPTYKTGLSITG